ncbi:hypothetical protein PSTG_16456 [Puccinia striiformis f. sp. tritici PST-78]|uniref:Uncharacterized protein n=1 Tax=Puccinia striiformis f. sp. tritici PST-78 TaxID=1165861 RepID=A0A0L0UTN1_9BASI|nr:hypothetical protein PSTG_16456 [Puccinia striiformis f. sp. tritici PST-78]
MSQQRHITHPMYTKGPFDITDSPTHDLKDGNNYGIFTSPAAIVVMDPKEGESNLIVDVSSYALRSTALTNDMVYSLTGRMIKNKNGTYKVFYEQCMNLCVGPSSNYIADTGLLLLNKVDVHGFGTIIKLNKVIVEDPDPNKEPHTDLHITLQHNNYDNLSRDSSIFETVYIVPGNKLLAKTHPLFDLGSEVVLVGYISSFNNQWIVTVGSFLSPFTMFAVGSGPVSGAMLATATPFGATNLAGAGKGSEAAQVSPTAESGREAELSKDRANRDPNKGG